MRRAIVCTVAIAAALIVLPGVQRGNELQEESQAAKPRRIARHFPERPPVDFEVETASPRGPRVILTNLYQEPLTAFVLQTEPKSSRERPQTLPWDALESNQTPVARGLSVLQSIPHIVGQPPPDITLVAAVWDDGSTYGAEESLQRIRANRALWAKLYQGAAQQFETGLAQGWAREQYLAAVDGLRQLTDPSPGLSESDVQRATFAVPLMLKRNLQGGMQVNGKPAPLEYAVKKLIEICRKQGESLAAAAAPVERITVQH